MDIKNIMKKIKDRIYTVNVPEKEAIKLIEDNEMPEDAMQLSLVRSSAPAQFSAW